VGTFICTYDNLACTSGTPTCTSGIAIPLVNACPQYVLAAWLVLNGSTCVVSFVSAATGGGVCN
jgi:hypothetical protein